LVAASTATLPVCSWNRPGEHPFVGNVVESVDRYTDIPEAVRTKLKQRMAKRQYDDIATIRRDSIVGKESYNPDLSDMHFGRGQVCRTVVRSSWSDSTVERGLVYCESGHCVIVPTVCRNVSRLTRLPPQPTTIAGGGAGGDPLAGEFPGAGQSFAQQSTPGLPGIIAGPPITGGAGAVPMQPLAATDGGGSGPAQPLAPLPWLTGGGTLVPVVVPTPVPEPGVWLLALLGLAGVGLAVTRRARRS
jgi:hypothetical protein